MTHGEWVMSSITLAYVIISFFTLRAISRQGDISDKAATAARENADALIGSERARLDADFVEHGSSRCMLQVTNLGKSPAVISSYVLRHSNFQMEITELPEGFGGQTAERNNINNFVLVGKPTDLLEFNIAHYISDEVRSGEQTAVFQAVIEYRDIFEKTHTTTVTYSYKPSTGKLVNLPKYNSYT